MGITKIVSRYFVRISIPLNQLMSVQKNKLSNFNIIFDIMKGL